MIPTLQERYDELFDDYKKYIAVEAYLLGAGYITQEQLEEAHAEIKALREEL